MQLLVSYRRYFIILYKKNRHRYSIYNTGTTKCVKSNSRDYAYTKEYVFTLDKFNRLAVGRYGQNPILLVLLYSVLSHVMKLLQDNIISRLSDGPCRQRHQPSLVVAN